MYKPSRDDYLPFFKEIEPIIPITEMSPLLDPHILDELRDMHILATSCFQGDEYYEEEDDYELFELIESLEAS